MIKGQHPAHRILAELGWRCVDGTVNDGRTLASPVSAYDRKLCRLAFLAPDIQRQICNGGQPLELTLERLMTDGVPVSWSAQRARYGISTVP